MNSRALMAEFLGPFVLCFVGILAINNAGPNNLPVVALAHGLAILVMVGAFAATSGAHFNPAVSFGLWLAKKIDGRTMAAYMLVQFLGGLAGAFAVSYLMGSQAVAIGTPAVGHSATVMQAVIAEAIGTFVLVTVIYGGAVDKKAPPGGPLFIGLTITAMIFAIGPISGCALNPARYFGPVMVGSWFGTDAWVWFVGPLVGGGLAGLFCSKFLFAESDAA